MQWENEFRGMQRSEATEHVNASDCRDQQCGCCMGISEKGSGHVGASACRGKRGQVRLESRCLPRAGVSGHVGVNAEDRGETSACEVTFLLRTGWQCVHECVSRGQKGEVGL